MAVRVLLRKMQKFDNQGWLDKSDGIDEWFDGLLDLVDKKGAS